MNKKKRPAFHGSDLEQIEAHYHIPKEQIISFGANVNPYGLSPTVALSISQHLDVITRYPDRNYTSLRRTIGSYCHVPMDHVVVGNGSTELISLLISQRNARHAVVIGPTYSEYERELSLTGGKITFYNLKETDDFVLDIPDFLKKLPSDADLVILCNPNNPTSSFMASSKLSELVAACQKLNVFVMIDETYVEFAPDIDIVTAMPLVDDYDNLMIIRGVSKFFAAPGLRLGYGVTSNGDFLTTIKTHQNPWSLNSIGAFAGELMLKDTTYIQKTKTLISSERSRICQVLDQLPQVKYYQPHGNFILVRIEKEGLTSFDIFDYAIRQGLMIRDCSSFESLDGEYIRFCIMMPEDNNRLLKCLQEILQ